ncbi:MAG: hypothetical protein ACI9BK_001178 [Acidimicrobiales bacterium]|jgi:hypothetical protein
MTASLRDHHRLKPGQALVPNLADVAMAGPSGVIGVLASPQIDA